MFQNLAYDVMALMKSAQDFEDEQALDWGQQQATTKATSAGTLESTLRTWGKCQTLVWRLSDKWEPLWKKVSAWISECKAWNASTNLLRSIMSRWKLELATVPVGDQNCNNGQGQMNQHQPAQRGMGEKNQIQENHDNVPQQNWPQAQYSQQYDGRPPPLFRNVNTGRI